MAPSIEPKLGRQPFLGIIDGPTGAGKSAVLEYLLKRHNASCVVGAKLTTRSRRVGDGDWELRFVEQIPAVLTDFTYSSVGWQYAVDAAEVERTLRSGLSYFVVCTDLIVTRKLARQFPAAVIYVHRPLSLDDISAVLGARGRTGHEEIQLRTIEVTEAVARYAENLSLYDFVILNLGGLAQLHEQIDTIVAECAVRSFATRRAPLAHP